MIAMLCATPKPAQPLSPMPRLPLVAYVHSVLQPGETIKAIGRLHWINYWKAYLLAAVAAVMLLYAAGEVTPTPFGRTLGLSGWAVLAVAALLFFLSWFHRRMTELSVTNHRVIYKTGFVRRNTVEMNMDKVETVNVDQSILGRILGYGTIHVLGTGQGIQGLRRIGAPIRLRNAITAR
jgi:uncharacterized membrane protein YdbT with pleckstrin-like domain